MKIPLVTPHLTITLLRKFTPTDTHDDYPEMIRWDVSFGRIRVILKTGHVWVWRRHKTKREWRQVLTFPYSRIPEKTNEIVKLIKTEME